MQTTKLKLAQTETLNQELEALLNEEISFGVKFDIVSVKNKLKPVLENLQSQRLELFKKYGKESKEQAGTYTLEGSKEFDKGVKALNELFSKEIEVKHTPFAMSDFKNLKSKIPYQLIYRLFKNKK